MHKYFVIKAVGAILLAIATAISWSLDIIGIIKLPVNWLPLVTFGVFCGLVAWMMYGIYKDRSRLLNSRPSIYVEPVREDETFYLKVHNDGEKGVFKAQIQLMAEDDPEVWELKNYIGYWKHANSGESEILKGHTDWIKIAKLNCVGCLECVYLEICYYGDKLNQANYISGSTQWIGGDIENKDCDTKAMTKHEYKLQVTISADPSLREGVYQGKFRLNVDRIEVETNFG